MKTSRRASLHIGFAFLVLLLSDYLCAAQPSPVIWTNASGVSVSGNNLTKTAGEGWGNAGASSTQSITSGDGYVESTVSETNKYRLFGLSNGDSHQSYNDVDFAFDLAIAGTLYIYEGGVYRGTFGTYATGDVLRVAVETCAVKYLKNGTLLYISTVAPTYPLLVDASLYSPSSTLNNVIISVANTTPTPYGPMQIFFDANNNTGFGTTSPIFNDDGVTGANVGKYFAIDGVTPGAAAYLGLGGHVSNPTDRVGQLAFYNWAMGGVDHRTASIQSGNDGVLGTGYLDFATAPNNVSPITRLRIASDGTVRIGNPFFTGGTLGVTALPSQTLIQTWFDNAGVPVASVLNNGKLYVRGAGAAIIMKAPNGQCFEKSLDNAGNWVTVPVSPCPP